MWEALRLARLKWKCRKGKLPPYVCAYLDQHRAQPGLKEAWEDIRFVVYDTETSGLNFRRDRMLALGAVSIRGGEIDLADSLECVVREAGVPEAETIAIHGIVPSESQAGLPLEQVTAQFLDLLRADVLVAQHALFDVRMVEYSIRKVAPGFFLYNHIVDTAHLAMKLEHPSTPAGQLDPRQFSLDALCARYDVTPSDRHTAWGDAMITAELLLKLLHRFRQQGRTQLYSLVN